jgi:hypothetical protein
MSPEGWLRAGARGEHPNDVGAAPSGRPWVGTGAYPYEHVRTNRRQDPGAAGDRARCLAALNEGML